ncbi:sensor histidine kinase [Terriglobus tenax]|uniref:sensor histidine kinase n=1 Tax=Terriglobus tenax TaxID=1111115 RepID=UPI0037D9AC09
MWARSGELRQVFTNIIVNAIDALPKDGKLTVRVSAASNHERACVLIADDGPGIPEAIRENVFQPFFSTKPKKGTGLDLWVSRTIIEKYGGSIQMRSWPPPRKPSGTVFRICVPCKASLPDSTQL